MNTAELFYQLEGILLTSFVTPFPHLLTYFLIAFILSKLGIWKRLPDWVKRWLVVVSSILAFFETYIYILYADRNAHDKSGAMILLFPLLWTGFLTVGIVLLELFIQVKKLLLLLRNGSRK